jgi:hypothetical protein
MSQRGRKVLLAWSTAPSLYSATFCVALLGVFCLTGRFIHALCGVMLCFSRFQSVDCSILAFQAPLYAALAGDAELSCHTLSSSTSSQRQQPLVVCLPLLSTLSVDAAC